MRKKKESHMPKCSAFQTSAENKGIKSTLGRQSDESSYLSRNRNLRVQLDHKGKRKRPSLAMRHLNLSQKLAENFWGSCDNHFLKTHTQLWNMVKNDAIVTSQLRLRSDIWHEIWSKKKKKSYLKHCGRGISLWAQFLWGQKAWEISKGEVLPQYQDAPSLALHLNCKLLSFLWSCL